ncbi:MAG: amino acid decarboxylase [Oscillospiraceae bacterium]
MDTPIYDFIENYINSDVSRLHMPGHKGLSFLGFENMDITEISGADELYKASGIIAKSENNASNLFGTKATFYSTEGSTQCIKAMLYISLMNRKDVNNRPIVLAARNVHKAFVYSAALLDFDVEWLYPKENGSICSCIVDEASLDKKLLSMAQKPFAVYITSPDYLGGISDIKALSKVCKKYDIPLLVDNAHGAYLKFLEKSRHPIDLGATMCCDSAHKTLPALTGSAYLHISNEFSSENGIRNAMAIFGSTSPSYLSLASLDLCNKYLSGSYKSDLFNTIEKVKLLKEKLKSFGLCDVSKEPLKISLSFVNLNYNGFEIAKILKKHKVECEYADADNVVLMFTPQNKQLDFERISSAFCSLKLEKVEMLKDDICVLPAVFKMTIRNAVFAKHESIPVNSALGRICGSPTVSCPPAIPIVISGEVISSSAIKLLNKYGLDNVEVVCE